MYTTYIVAKYNYKTLQPFVGGMDQHNQDNKDTTDLRISYCINLFWLSDDCKKRPNSDEIEKIKSVCLKWRRDNSAVFLWTNCIDSFTDIPTITIKSIMDENYVDTTHILDDKKDVSIVTDIAIKNILINKGINIFLRIDFLKNLIAHVQLKHYDYVVITDLDINTLPEDGKLLQCDNNELKEEAKSSTDRFYTYDFIFDIDTKTKLDLLGVVFACRITPPFYYENSFIIFKNMLEVMHLIDLLLVKFCAYYISKLSDYYLKQAGLLYDWYRIFYVFLMVLLQRNTFTHSFSIGGEEEEFNKTILDSEINQTNYVRFFSEFFTPNHPTQEIHPRNIIDTNTTHQTAITDDVISRRSKRSEKMTKYNLPVKQLIMPASKH